MKAESTHYFKFDVKKVIYLFDQNNQNSEKCSPSNKLFVFCLKNSNCYNI